MKLAVLAHPSRKEATDVADELIAAARRAGVEAALVELAELDAEGASDVDVIAAVGGDGTFLAAAGAALVSGVPVFGVNVGYVGYLTEVRSDEIDLAAQRLGTGIFGETQRVTVAAHLPGGTTVVGVNDVVIEKVVSQRVVHLEVEVDDEPFTTYRADAVIVATPTGSTAYSFSAGGPAVDPNLAALLITPVASHSAFTRPVVLRPDARIRFRVGSDRPVRVNYDGREAGTLEAGGVIEVTRGDTPLRVLTFDGHRFPHAIHDEFGRA